MLESAERLFREQGFGANTVRRIATDAKVSTGTSPDAPLLAFVLMLRQKMIVPLLAETVAATPPCAQAAVPAGIAVATPPRRYST